MSKYSLSSFSESIYVWWDFYFYFVPSTYINPFSFLVKSALMGSSHSREESRGHTSLHRLNSRSWYHDLFRSSPYDPLPPQEPQHNPPLGDHVDDTRMCQSSFLSIADDYYLLYQVTTALANVGLESLNLIVGVDFTKSNEWTGNISFDGKNLHHTGHYLNPYEKAISIVGKTLAHSDEDNMIPCFGFGDASTRDKDVFSFYPDKSFCNGIEELSGRYREIVPHIQLAGPTSFAPIIEMAMTIVERSCGLYHVLVIIADGQVTRSVDTGQGMLSPQEQNTVDAIVQASNLPLSIILVGVGDGPWDMMNKLYDNIPARAFNNFQFVNFTDIMSKNIALSRKETEFALVALMEILSQYKAIIELNILGNQKGNIRQRVPLAPCFRCSEPSHHTHFQVGSTSQTPPSTYDSQICCICLTNPNDMAFRCGHQTCEECSKELETCPVCRKPIQMKIKLYS